MQIEHQERFRRASVYNKQIELVHLDDRRAIKALPLDKQAFSKVLTQHLREKESPVGHLER
jgi:hypothetical protein